MFLQYVHYSAADIFRYSNHSRQKQHVTKKAKVHSAPYSQGVRNGWARKWV